jgi:hypothetical protein
MDYEEEETDATNPLPPPLPPSPPKLEAALYDPEIVKEYNVIKAELENKLEQLNMERQHIIEQQQDATFINGTIAEFENFMVDQLTELEELLRSDARDRRRPTSTKKKTGKRGAEAIDTTDNSRALAIDLVPDAGGGFVAEDDEDDWLFETDKPITKKRAT